MEPRLNTQTLTTVADVQSFGDYVPVSETKSGYRLIV